MTAEATATRDLRTPTWTIAAVTAATAVLALRSPHGGGYGICPILFVTGYQCPTCGGLRAVHDMAHLDFAGAWAMNPLLTVVLPLVAAAMIVWWWRAWRNRPPLTIPTPLTVIAAVLIIGFGIVRNL